MERERERRRERERERGREIVEYDMSRSCGIHEEYYICIQCSDGGN
jgi:hypothetical protein